MPTLRRWGDSEGSASRRNVPRVHAVAQVLGVTKAIRAGILLTASVHGALMAGASMLDLDVARQWNQVCDYGRVDFVEVCCTFESPMSAAANESGFSTMRLGLWNGFDLSRPRGVEKALQWVDYHKPRRAWGSPPCTPWSKAQNWNIGTEEKRAALVEKRRWGRKVIRGTLKVLLRDIQWGGNAYFEQPDGAASWFLDEVINFTRQCETCCRTPGCCWGFREPSSGLLMGKFWRVASTEAHGLAPIENRKCDGYHEHAKNYNVCWEDIRRPCARRLPRIGGRLMTLGGTRRCGQSALQILRALLSLALDGSQLAR
jgi:hypothetical protein